MKRVFSNTLAAVMLFASLSCNSYAQNSKKPAKEKEDRDEWLYNTQKGEPGTWKAYTEGDRMYFQFTGNHWNNGHTFMKSEFTNLPSAGGEFTLVREAGTMSFNGTFENGLGMGIYKFTANDAFKTYLEQMGYSGLKVELMINVFFTNIN